MSSENYTSLQQWTASPNSLRRNWSDAIDHFFGFAKTSLTLTDKPERDFDLLSDPNSRIHFEDAWEVNPSTKKMKEQKASAYEALRLFFGCAALVKAILEPNEENTLLWFSRVTECVGYSWNERFPIQCDALAEKVMQNFAYLSAHNASHIRMHCSLGEAWDLTRYLLSKSEEPLIHGIFARLPHHSATMRVVGTTGEHGVRGCLGNLHLDWFSCENVAGVTWERDPCSLLLPYSQDFAEALQASVDWARLQEWGKNRRGTIRWNVVMDAHIDQLTGNSMGLAQSLGLYFLWTEKESNRAIVMTGALNDINSGRIDNVADMNLKVEIIEDHIAQIEHVFVPAGNQPFYQKGNAEKYTAISSLKDAINYCEQWDVWHQYCVAIHRNPANGGFSLPDGWGTFESALWLKLPLIQEIAPKTYEQIEREAKRQGIKIDNTDGLSSSLNLKEWDEIVQRRIVTNSAPLEIENLLMQATTPCIIMGYPGSGKSTLADYLLWKCSHLRDPLLIEGRRIFPLRVRLREWEQSCAEPYRGDFGAYIASLMEDSPTAEQWRRRRNQGEVLLILDGLDEIAEERVGDLRRVLHEQGWASGRVVVTCRTVGRSRLSRIGFGDCAIFTMMHLSKDDQAQYICSYPFHTLVADQFQSQVMERNVQLMAKNPMLLSILCYVADDSPGYILPKLRPGIYCKAFEHMLRPLAAVEEIDVDIIAYGLKYLAWTLLNSEEPQRQFSHEQGRDILKNAIRERWNPHFETEQASKLLHRIVKNSRIITGSYASRYEFLHSTFQEYAAAEFLKEQIDKKGWQEYAPQIRQLACQSQYQETLVFMSGLLKEPHVLLTLLAQQATLRKARNDSDQLELDVLLSVAARCLLEMPSDKNDYPIVGKIATAVVRKWWKYGNQYDRAHPVFISAVQTIAFLDSPVEGIPFSRWIEQRSLFEIMSGDAMKLTLMHCAETLAASSIQRKCLQVLLLMPEQSPDQSTLLNIMSLMFKAMFPRIGQVPIRMLMWSMSMGVFFVSKTFDLVLKLCAGTFNQNTMGRSQQKLTDLSSKNMLPIYEILVGQKFQVPKEIIPQLKNLIVVSSDIDATLARIELLAISSPETSWEILGLQEENTPIFEVLCFWVANENNLSHSQRVKAAGLLARYPKTLEQMTTVVKLFLHLSFPKIDFEQPALVSADMDANRLEVMVAFLDAFSNYISCCSQQQRSCLSELITVFENLMQIPTNETPESHGARFQRLPVFYQRELLSLFFQCSPKSDLAKEVLAMLDWLSANSNVTDDNDVCSLLIPIVSVALLKQDADDYTSEFFQQMMSVENPGIILNALGMLASLPTSALQKIVGSLQSEEDNNGADLLNLMKKYPENSAIVYSCCNIFMRLDEIYLQSLQCYTAGILSQGSEESQAELLEALVLLEAGQIIDPLVPDLCSIPQPSKRLQVAILRTLNLAANRQDEYIKKCLNSKSRWVRNTALHTLNTTISKPVNYVTQ